MVPQAGWLQALTGLAFVLHIGGGAVGLVSGTVAILARKGGRLHRGAGKVFFVSMLFMGVFACWLAVAMPDQIANLFGGLFALYLVVTAWLTVRRPERAVGPPVWIGLIVAAALFAPFGLIAFDLVTGTPPPFKSGVPFKGPVVVAFYVFTAVTGIAAAMDLKLVLTGGVAGVARISRHLWRMSLGLALAYGSGFTNGFARLLPGPYHVPTIFFLPQFLPILLLFFWLIRVRVTDGWRQAAAQEYSTADSVGAALNVRTPPHA
jgi:hypothetical protein